jgi:hypothetical protein
MAGTVGKVNAVPWWKEPTKDQWYAYLAAWLGWTLDAFDFTIFLLIMLPVFVKGVVRGPSSGVSDFAVAGVALGVEADFADRRPVADLA